MKKRIAKYHNDLNEICFDGFTSLDFDIFMMICTRIRDEGLQKVRIPYSEIKDMAKIGKNYTAKGFEKKLQQMNRRLLKLDYTKILEDGVEADFVFFPTFVRNGKEGFLEVSVNEYGAYLLNGLTRDFTSFELRQYVSLKSKYSKTLYRLLMQFKTTGERFILMEDLRRRMDIPESYSNKAVTDEIIKPSVDSLKDIFVGLSYVPKRGSGRGRPIRGYEFSFKPDVTEKKSIEANKKSRKKKTKFHNFEGRRYDYAALEKALLGS